LRLAAIDAAGRIHLAGSIHTHHWITDLSGQAHLARNRLTETTLASFPPDK
jgi:hypothetical protein